MSREKGEVTGEPLTAVKGRAIGLSACQTNISASAGSIVYASLIQPVKVGQGGYSVQSRLPLGILSARSALVPRFCLARSVVHIESPFIYFLWCIVRAGILDLRLVPRIVFAFPAVSLSKEVELAHRIRLISEYMTKPYSICHCHNGLGVNLGRP